MDAQEYYQSLLAQGYKSEDSVAFTQQHYPEFTLAPVSEEPPLQMPVPAPMPMAGASPGTDVGQTIVVGKSKGKALRIISGSIGIVMSIAILVWMMEILDTTSGNIDYYSDEGTSSADTFVSALETVQVLSYVALALIVGIIGISVLTMLNKSKWWYLPAISLIMLLLLTGMGYYTTNSTNQYYSDCDSEIYSDCGELRYESTLESDAMILGYCNAFALIFIGLLSLISKPKSSLDETVESEEVWVKGAWIIAIILLVFCSLATYMTHDALMNPTKNRDNSGGNGFEFSGKDGEALLDGQNNNTLLHITMDQGRALNFASLSVKIVVDDGAYFKCELYSGGDSDGGCVIFQDWDDNKWDVDEEITILENGYDLCDGSGSGYCRVVVTIGEVDYSSEEDTVLQVLTIIVY